MVYAEAELLPICVLTDVFVTIIPHYAYLAATKYTLHHVRFSDLDSFPPRLTMWIYLAIVNKICFFN